jgi:hypothetical protein
VQGDAQALGRLPADGVTSRDPAYPGGNRLGVGGQQRKQAKQIEGRIVMEALIYSKLSRFRYAVRVFAAMDAFYASHCALFLPSSLSDLLPSEPVKSPHSFPNR